MFYGFLIFCELIIYRNNAARDVSLHEDQNSDGLPRNPCTSDRYFGQEHLKYGVFERKPLFGAALPKARVARGQATACPPALVGQKMRFSFRHDLPDGKGG
jgi:hypothetical protein